jgi:hypothetical protein
MNPIFSKLPRSYAADVVWSRLFFEKKLKIGADAGSVKSWNNEKAGNA